MKQGLLTVSEVAEITRHKERTIRAWIASGRLKSLRIGVSVRVPADAVEKLIERAQEEAHTEPRPSAAIVRSTDEGHQV